MKRIEINGIKRRVLLIDRIFDGHYDRASGKTLDPNRPKGYEEMRKLVFELLSELEEQ